MGEISINFTIIILSMWFIKSLLQIQMGSYPNIISKVNFNKFSFKNFTVNWVNFLGILGKNNWWFLVCPQTPKLFTQSNPLYGMVSLRWIWLVIIVINFLWFSCCWFLILLFVVVIVVLVYVICRKSIQIFNLNFIYIKINLIFN